MAWSPRSWGSPAMVGPVLWLQKEGGQHPGLRVSQDPMLLLEHGGQQLLAAHSRHILESCLDVPLFQAWPLPNCPCTCSAQLCVPSSVLGVGAAL